MAVRTDAMMVVTMVDLMAAWLADLMVGSMAVQTARLTVEPLADSLVDWLVAKKAVMKAVAWDEMKVVLMAELKAGKMDDMMGAKLRERMSV